MSSQRRKPLEYFLALQYPFRVSTELDVPGYFILFPDLPGCMSQVDHMTEIGIAADEVRQLWIESEYERGNEIPLPTYYEEYSGKFNVRLPRTLHHALADAAAGDGASLNQYVATLLARGDAQARVENRLAAIEERLAINGRANVPSAGSRVADDRATYDAHAPRDSGATATRTSQAASRKSTPVLRPKPKRAEKPKAKGRA